MKRIGTRDIKPKWERLREFVVVDENVPRYSDYD